MPVSAVVIVKNEAAGIRACLESLSFCDEIVVVDSGSTDQTIPVAQTMPNIRIFQRSFDDFSSQKNFAVAQASHPWIFSLDADERASASLQREILAIIGRKDRDKAAYAVPRQTFLFGSEGRFASYWDLPIRLFRKDQSHFEGVVHEGLRVRGKKGHLKHAILHYSTKSVGDYLRKLNHYTDLEARLLQERGGRPGIFAFVCKPPLRFLQNYIGGYGIMKKNVGFIYAILSSYYEFVRCAKHWERIGRTANRNSGLGGGSV